VCRLTSGSDPVATVAHDLGFAAPGHFSRFFRQHLGITPSDYRRVVNLFESRAAPDRDRSDAR
jgi:AraC-like DNA-binding protein